MSISQRLQPFYPALFVFLWSTGYIGAKFIRPYAEPFTFLLFRYVAAVLVLLGLLVWVKGRWPREPMRYLHLAVAGLGIHALYLGGVFVAVRLGMPATTVGLVVNLQPIVMVALAWLWLGERVSVRQMLGFALGFAGVAMIVLKPVSGAMIPAESWLAAVIALMGISFGAIYQRRFCMGIDGRVAACVQYAVCALLYAPLAPAVETMHIVLAPAFVFAFAWFVLALSIGAIWLLYQLVESRATVDVAGLFFLVPGLTAIQAWLLFDETLAPLALMGIVLAAGGVWLARR